MKIYLIQARTGCTCCSGENFREGPYLDRNVADNIAVDWRIGINNPLAPIF